MQTTWISTPLLVLYVASSSSQLIPPMRRCWGVFVNALKFSKLLVDPNPCMLAWFTSLVSVTCDETLVESFAIYIETGRLCWGWKLTDVLPAEDVCAGSCTQSDGNCKEIPSSLLLADRKAVGVGSWFPWGVGVSDDGVDVAIRVGNCKGFRVGWGPIDKRWPFAYKIPNVRPPPIRILKINKPIIAGMPSLVFLGEAGFKAQQSLLHSGRRIGKAPKVLHFYIEYSLATLLAMLVLLWVGKKRKPRG